MCLSLALLRKLSRNSSPKSSTEMKHIKTPKVKKEVWLISPKEKRQKECLRPNIFIYIMISSICIYLRIDYDFCVRRV